MCVDYLYYIRVGFVFSTLIINEISLNDNRCFNTEMEDSE